ncbi:MAG TPA: F0F1 ATP synthase subunit delta [Steroidobacteraceae bacterium]|jgi:F-type H+-transporting ATPase subunit delta|nr:F0F1 ATP synthase subunit delta [Steroidobacteraceae bacterium]
MTERVTIARPYAKAAFAEARKTQRLAHWSDGLQLAAAVSVDERVKPLFGNPHVTPAQLVELIAGVGGQTIDAEARRFLVVLAENGRLGLLPEIAQLYEKMRAEQERVLDVTLKSAVALSAEQRERFTAALRKRFDRDIRLHTEIDTSLLGGAVLQADDLVIDGSVRGGLAQLASQIAG